MTSEWKGSPRSITNWRACAGRAGTTDTIVFIVSSINAKTEKEKKNMNF